MIYKEESEVAAQVVQFYKTLYQETEERRPFGEDLEFDQLGGLDKGWLERRFEKEEILLDIGDLEGDKALSPDGFSMAFYHHC